MKTLRNLTTGYPRSQSYLLDIQNELLTLSQGLLGSISFDVVLQGCDVTDNHNGTVNIASGLVFINGQVLRYDGGTNVVADGSQSFSVGSPVLSNPQTFAPPSSTVNNVYTETKAITGALISGNTRQLIVGLTLLTFETYIDLRIKNYAVKGQLKEYWFTAGSADDTDFLAKFDATSGLGLTPDQSGWACLHIYNPALSAGLVTMGAGTYADPVTSATTVFAVGSSGGELKHKLTVAELAAHTHSQEWVAGTGGASGSGGTLNDGHQPTGSTGGDQPHNNVQPYIVVYRTLKVV